MKDKLIKYGLLFLCIIISLTLFGCKNNSITFYRESAVSKAVNNLNLPINKTEVKRTKGVYIYKDKSSTNTSNSNVQFGPRDIDFGMPSRY